MSCTTWLASGGGRAVLPGRLGEAYRRLVALRIDIAAVTQMERTASAVGSRAVAAISDVELDVTIHNLVVLINGMVFVAAVRGDRVTQVTNRIPARATLTLPTAANSSCVRAGRVR